MLGVWIGKLTLLALRLLHRRATSLPGKLALRVSPRLMARLGKQLDRCIVVTGTNGKTTTASLLAAAFRQESAIIHNTEGANLPQGLVSTLLRHTNWRGKLVKKTALFEIDEATLPLVARDLPIKVAVVTNVFRDQLDRYGELDTTIEKLLVGLRATEALVVLNADDPLARHIGLHAGRDVVYFGMAKHHLQVNQRNQMRDGAFCMQCGHELSYDGFFYGQLGLYHCPDCDFFRPVPEFIGAFDQSHLDVVENGLPDTTYQLPVRGIFNVYNALAAIAAARVCGLAQSAIAQGFAQFTPPLGRMQAFSTNPPTILNLIKNPTGCDSVLQAIVADPGEKILCVAINDMAADGKDVSWLWDADFELVAETPSIRYCVTSGLRAEDMALRLKYGGFSVERIMYRPELADGLDAALMRSRELGGLPVYVLSTYTALYPMAELLQRRTHNDEQTAVHRASVS